MLLDTGRPDNSPAMRKLYCTTIGPSNSMMAMALKKIGATWLAKAQWLICKSANSTKAVPEMGGNASVSANDWRRLMPR